MFNSIGNGEFDIGSSEDFLPLKGIRVIDFTRVLAGPYATMMMAELGADVVKVEAPTGDETRQWGPPFIDESSAYFHAVNQGKRSVVADLNHLEGQEFAQALIASGDVILENFRPGVTTRLGIDAPSVLSKFPEKVYGSITGFGTTGPLAKEAGTEVIVEAESGIMSITGSPDGEPVRFGVAMVDIATGLALSNAVMGALVARAQTGKGRHVSVSLYETAVSALGTSIASLSAGGDSPQAWGSSHPSIVPYSAYRASDGYIVLGATNDAMFQRLWEAFNPDGREMPLKWSRNADRVGDRRVLDKIIQNFVDKYAAEEVVELLRAHGVLAARVLTPTQAAKSDQGSALGLITERNGVMFSRSPMNSNRTRSLMRAPVLGEHTEELRAEVEQHGVLPPL